MLIHHLWSYLASPPPSETVTNFCKVLCCPGGRYDNIPYRYSCYYSVTRTNNIPELPWYPFGNVNDQKPQKVPAVAAVIALSECWALADFDCEAPPDFHRPEFEWFDNSTWVSILVRPAHRTVRNYLYFDSHVGTKKVAGPQNY